MSGAVDALVVLADTVAHRREQPKSACSRLNISCRRYIEVGWLSSYGPNIVETARRSGSYWTNIRLMCRLSKPLKI